MRIFKFGGASVKDPESVKNVIRIVREHRGGLPLVVVLSAMDKTTNALEQLCACFMDGRKQEMLSHFEGSFKISASNNLLMSFNTVRSSLVSLARSHTDSVFR